MTYVVIALWILMWGIAGYFTVRAIQVYIEKKRIKKALATGFKPIPKSTRISAEVLFSDRLIYSPYYRSFYMKGE